MDESKKRFTSLLSRRREESLVDRSSQENQTTRLDCETPLNSSHRRGTRRGAIVGLLRSFFRNQPDSTLALAVLFLSAVCITMTVSICRQKIVTAGSHTVSETIFSRNTLQQASLAQKASLHTQDDEAQETSSFVQSMDEQLLELDTVTVPQLALELMGDNGDDVFVDYAVSGNRVKFSEAIRHNHPFTIEEHLDYHLLEDTEEKGNKEHTIDDLEIRLFVAVTAAACSDLSRRRRDGIRETWMQDALSMYDNVTIMFFVGQPASHACDAATMHQLREEIREHNDIVIVRGDDSYDNLSNKTLGMLKYVLSAPERYTHLLKTDDDTYVRVHQVLDSLGVHSETPLMKGVYKGRVENEKGFDVFRDPKSKWYFSYEHFNQEAEMEISGTMYAAGWGYILSRDLMFHAMKKVYAWDYEQTHAPAWHNKLKMLEDVMIGALVSDKIDSPDSDQRYNAPWHPCTSKTAVIHLDVDSPRLLRGLYDQELSGLWALKTIVCSSGRFTSGDYNTWKKWRNSRLDQGQRI